MIGVIIGIASVVGGLRGGGFGAFVFRVVSAPCNNPGPMPVTLGQTISQEVDGIIDVSGVTGWAGWPTVMLAVSFGVPFRGFEFTPLFLIVLLVAAVAVVSGRTLIEDYEAAVEVVRSIKRAFNTSGLEIAFPQSTPWWDQTPESA